MQTKYHKKKVSEIIDYQRSDMSLNGDSRVSSRGSLKVRAAAAYVTAEFAVGPHPRPEPTRQQLIMSTKFDTTVIIIFS